MKIVLYGLISICVISGISFYVWSISRLPVEMEMYVFDTKGYPSIFIRTPDDTRILIDGGANGDIVRNLTTVLPFYSRRIDTVIVTSDEANNVTGLIDVISRYKVGTILIPKITSRQLNLGSSTDLIFETFDETVNRFKIPVKEVERGDELILNKNETESLGLNNQLKAEILFPVSTTSEFKYSRASSPELIMRIEYGDTHFLLIGGASLKVQKFIANSTSTLRQTNNGVSSDVELASDVLIIPHGVSSAYLSSNLINATKPEFVIYSQNILKSTFNTKGIKTDPLYMILDSNRFNLKQKSTIEVLSDGKSVKIE